VAWLVENHSDRDWKSQLWARMRHLWWLKTAGICLFMWVFFALYFEVLRHPPSPPRIMPLTALDRAIPFMPSALLAYGSLWLYVGLPAGMMATFKNLLHYGAWMASLCLTGLAIFYFYPTAIPPLTSGIDLARHPGFALLQGVDASGNAFPSLHVATAVFSAFWIDHVLRGVASPPGLRLASIVWCLLIMLSTLAVKQHVLLDLLAGILLGALFAVISLRWRWRWRWR